MQLKNIRKLSQIGVLLVLPLLVLLGLTVHMAGQAQAQGGTANLIFNGNFEFGFYTVPELGFEAPEIGHVPNDWNWYKNQAYGKYNIYNNETFGIVCADDIATPASPEEEEDSIFGPIPDYVAAPPNNSLSLHMQSTDQQDARLGIYQTVDVVPGQDYRFSMSGTIQVQAGARVDEPEAQNHNIELVFDHTGGTDWRAIPHEKRTLIPFKEQELVFRITEEEDIEEELVDIEDYETVVKARSDKMTIFITAWRRYANWRTAIFSIDCVSLVPLSLAGIPPSAQPAPADDTEASAPASTDEVQPAVLDAAAGDTQAETAAAEESTVIIPPSGGILEDTGNSILIAIVSIVVISGLIGAGIWNMRR